MLDKGAIESAPSSLGLYSCLIRALPFGLSTSPIVFTKILTRVLANSHLHGVRLHMYLDNWTTWTLVGSSRANILAQVNVPKIRAGHKSGEIGFNPFPESHQSGNIVGLPCRSGQAIRQESDQMDLHSGGIHSSAVTTRCTITPSTETLRAVWLGLQAFGHKLDNATIALMSDNTSAIAYLRNQGGGGDKITFN